MILEFAFIIIYIFFEMCSFPLIIVVLQYVLLQPIYVLVYGELH